MIPVSLRLRNFMCYHEGLPPLEFDDFHVACLSGPNGSGKSALLDAITWALWGRARSRSHDDLITVGAQEMEVEFEFLLEGNRYRVLRQRDSAARGGRGKSQLDLQIYSPDGWRPMAEESIRATEQKIVDLLRMDYDTFINSAFLLQGRADEFTLKPPGERKQILADILGLSRYDELEQRARARLRAEEGQIEALSLVLEDLEEELARREALEASLQEARERVSLAQAEDNTRQEALSALRERVAELEATAQQAEALRERVGNLDAEVNRLQERLDQQQKQIEEVVALQERAEEIEAAHAHLQEARERHEALSRAAGQLLALSERRQSLEQAIERARSQLVTEREVLRRSLAENETRLKDLPAVERRLAEIQDELQSLQERAAEREKLLQEAQDKAAQVRTLKAACQQLRDEMKALRERVDLLEERAEDAAHCPLCRSLLGPEELDNIRHSYEEQGRGKRAQYDAHQARIKELEAQLRRLRDRQQELDRELSRVRVLEREQASLEKDQRELAALTEEQDEKQRQMQALEQLLSEGGYAEEERAALAELQKEIAELHYDHQEHQALEKELARAPQVEAELRRLQMARDRLADARARQEEAQALYKGRQQELAAEQERLQELQGRLAELPSLRERRQELEEGLAAAQKELGEARVALGAVQQDLERLQELQSSYQKRQEAHAEALERRGIYEELTAALGKRGVQAMLIETAVPEIEREANELLRRMTGGEMSLQLDMQRQTKSGTVQETLDINIYDVQGTRSYEMYSGGEKFRINFALRIALSRLLARRAGASLQTLVVDEGFGTQDAEGRERLVEAIQSVQDEFEKILVITHIQELKELFPARIEVAKTSEGSRWTIL